MNKYIRIIGTVMAFVIFIFCNTSANTMAASNITKEKSARINILNSEVDDNTLELVYSIKNRESKDIKIKGVYIERKQEGNYIKMKPKKVIEKNAVVATAETYTKSILLKKYFKESTLKAGKYRLLVKYKSGKEYKKVYKYFYVASTKEEYVDKSEGDVESSEGGSESLGGVCCEPSSGACAGESVVVTRIENFKIGSDGKASVLIFTESDMTKVDKVKIYMQIQTFKDGKWVKYKRYTSTKKSNLAFMSKSLSIKDKGFYRMKATVKMYRKNRKVDTQYFKTKAQIRR